MKELKVILIGAGGRGRRYTNVMKEMDGRFKLVAVADPNESRRKNLQRIHDLAPESCFESWEPIFDRPKFADVVVISTMDKLHYAPSMKALELGYDLLLEKPIAPTPEECVGIQKQAEKYGARVMVCHVLRYAPFFKQLKALIDDGLVGTIISMEHVEGVGNIRHSLGYVRGRWNREETSAPMLLAKSCHDLDLIQWYVGKECKRIQSFGSLSHFKKENAPEGAAEYCIDNCPHKDTCYYYAPDIYAPNGVANPKWLTSLKGEWTDEDVIHALKTTQPGRCIYKCDNNVVDHQTVNMEFEGGTTVTMTMSAFTKGGRSIHIMGTKGELWACPSNKEAPMVFYDFATQEKRLLDVDPNLPGEGIMNGHGGGDGGIVDALYRYMIGELTAEEVSEIGISVKTHMLVFAAEEARHSGQVISVPEYEAKFYQ
ncbi:MAG: Gfo/Idh/MocA family oxidoreductase [Clostridia bacterium]|nr:Gfo/Idh/MocA family oxidoreductase [Clostridia bacterium]